MSSAMNDCALRNDWLPAVLRPVLIIEFIVGLLGNGLALWIFCWRIKTLKSSTVYLFNLAVADFLLIVCLPFRTDYYIRERDWIFGDIPCRVMLFMVSLNRAGSIVFLTVIAVDRYFKVVHPHHMFNVLSKSYAVKISLLLWGLTGVMTVYLMTESHLEAEGEQNSSVQHCESFKLGARAVGTYLWHITFFIAEFIVPLCIIFSCTLCISKELRKRGMTKDQRITRALQAVQAVAGVFIFCFLPSSVGIIVVMIAKSLGNCQAYQLAGQIFYTSLSLTYFNSMLDPVVYYFSSPTFRQALKNVTSKKEHSKQRGTNRSKESDTSSV
ncbi:HCAR3 protein, partial [Polypterus senegalus]|nr:HCAR3 protein [Polypterus senegalus]